MKTTYRKIKSLLNFGLLFIASTSVATNYYVNATTGNNSNNGLTTGAAKQTLGWISYNSSFQPGDTIFIMNGTYTSTSSDIITLTSSGSAASPFVITNYPGHSPLLQHTVKNWNGVKVLSGVHHVIINGLTVKGIASTINLSDAINQPTSCDNQTGSVDPKFNGNGITIESRTGAVAHHITVRNCKIFECCGGGCSSGGADYLTFENNVIYNNCWYTIYGTSGISNLSSRDYDNHSSGGYSMIIKNNIVYTRRRLRGRQPLWGMGVMSLMVRMLRPAICSARTADSRPAPGPLTTTSISRSP